MTSLRQLIEWLGNPAVSAGKRREYLDPYWTTLLRYGDVAPVAVSQLAQGAVTFEEPDDSHGEAMARSLLGATIALVVVARNAALSNAVRANVRSIIVDGAPSQRKAPVQCEGAVLRIASSGMNWPRDGEDVVSREVGGMICDGLMRAEFRQFEHSCDPQTQGNAILVRRQFADVFCLRALDRHDELIWLAAVQGEHFLNQQVAVVDAVIGRQSPPAAEWPPGRSA